MPSVKEWTYTRGGFPRALSLTDVSPPEPSTLSPTQIQIQTKAFSINPVDVQAINLPIWSLPGYGYPKGTGCDFSGIVLHAGSQSGYSVGDEVFGMNVNIGGKGTAAEIVTRDTKDPGVVVAKKPAGWGFVDAAAIPLVWLTARTCVEQLAPYVEEGGWVAVLGGSSSCGMYVVKIAKQRGWKVVASCSTRNVEFVKGLGADVVVDYTKQKVPEEVRKVKPDAVVDCVGGTECLRIAERYVTIVGDKTNRSAMGGSAIYTYNPQMVWRWVLGYLGFGVKYDCIILENNAEYLKEATKLKADEIVVESTFKFEDLPQALEKLVTGKIRGKLVGVFE